MKPLLRPAWSQRRSAFLAAILLMLLVSPAARAQTASNEYQIKAAFLFHFLQFTTWPEAASEPAGAPVCVGVLGDDPFGTNLDDALRGESLQGRRLIVKRSRKAADLSDCRLVFVSRSEKDRLGQVLHEFDSGPALTVSETEGFTRAGGIVNFVIDAKRVRFELSPASARKRGLRLSSQLIRLGIVTDAADASMEPLL